MTKELLEEKKIEKLEKKGRKFEKKIRKTITLIDFIFK
jgi:hypothetical protein